MRESHSDLSRLFRRSRGNRILLSAIASWVGVGGWNVATSRGALLTPAGLAPGTKFRYIYVTTLTINGTSKSASNYDAVAAADAATLGDSTYNSSPVTWQALVSTDSLNASSKVTTSDSFYTLGGVEVAASTAALFNSASVPLLNPVESDGTEVWTGSFANGTENYSKGMGDGSSDNGVPFYGYFGYSNLTNGSWLEGDDRAPLATTFPVYAFSSELTVPVPEPASIAMLAVTLVPILLRRGKCRKF